MIKAGESWLPCGCCVSGFVLSGGGERGRGALGLGSLPWLGCLNANLNLPGPHMAVHTLSLVLTMCVMRKDYSLLVHETLRCACVRAYVRACVRA